MFSRCVLCWSSTERCTKDVTEKECELQNIPLSSFMSNMSPVAAVSPATLAECRLMTEVKILEAIQMELVPIMRDPYTTEDDDSDLSEIEISSTSMCGKFKEIGGMVFF